MLYLFITELNIDEKLLSKNHVDSETCETVIEGTFFFDNIVFLTFYISMSQVLVALCNQKSHTHTHTHTWEIIMTSKLGKS